MLCGKMSNCFLFSCINCPIAESKLIKIATLTPGIVVSSIFFNFQGRQCGILKYSGQSRKKGR